MIFLRACFLFSLISIHFIGGAVLFRRIFPRESPWLGFFFPAFAIAMLCNFIEHGLPVTVLPWFLAVTTIGSIWLLVTTTAAQWRFLWKPAVVFLVALAIPFTLHLLKPDIGPIRDGPLDVFLIASFCQGDTVPPDSTWMPGYTVKYYYDFTHYAASVMVRLFNLDVGTGYNLAGALVSGLILFTAGAIAYCLGRHRLWVALLLVLMTATAMDGDTPYLWLFSPQIKEPDDSTNFFNHTSDPTPGAFDWLIPRGTDYWATHELIPLGYWGWAGCFHSVAAGQLLTLFSILCVIEMFNRPRTNWPWIGGLWAILLMLICSTWGVPMISLIFLSGAIWCIRRKIYPENWRLVVMVTACAVAAMTPMLMYFLQTRTPWGEMPREGHTPWQEFVVQWWPAFVPWLLLLFWWKRTHPVVRILQVLLPLLFIFMEYYNIGVRIDMTGKCWGYIYGAAWAVFVPAMLAMRSWILRGVMVLFVAATVISGCFWVDFYHRTILWNDVGELNGKGDMRTDPSKARIFNVVAGYNHQIMIVGRSIWAYAENPLLANLTHNKAYIAWCFHCAVAFHPDTYDVASSRDEEVNDLFASKMADPLQFLRDRNITLLTVWPDDHIDPKLVSTLQQQLAPDYIYEDCRGFHPVANTPPAGVFVYRGLVAPGRPDNFQLDANNG